VQICSSCGGELSDQFRFCGFCGFALETPALVKDSRKTVTVVFCDLKGSTNMGEALDSESLRELMSRYFEVMSQILEGHGGTVEKYIGDAIMAVFGLRQVHEDDALRAVRAAADMRAALAEFNAEVARVWGVTLTNRLGVNTGEVIAGEPMRGQRLVIGDAVNVAARLEQAAPPNEVLVGPLTYRLVRDHVEVEPVEPLELKGKSERMPAYLLLSVLRRQGPMQKGHRPMVGRDAELAHLSGALGEATAGRAARMVTVLGQPGVGKSTLMAELRTAVEDRATVVNGRCLPYGRGITFWPLLEIVQSAAGISEEDSPEAARASLNELAGHDEDVVERVASVLGLSSTQFPVDETFWGVRKLLEAMAHRQPVVIVFEDIHWAELTLLDLIEHLLRSAEGPMLLVCLARPELLELRDGWGDQPGATALTLAPLSDDDIGAVIDSVLGDGELQESVRERIVEAAGGNPLFVEQMLSMMIDDGLLRQEDGVWSAARGLDQLDVPPSVQALVAARLDRLQLEERQVIEPASVIGVSFPHAAIEELVDESLKPAVGLRLSSLSARQLIHPEGTAPAGDDYRFDHILIRDAAYGRLLKRERALLHERFADWATETNRERKREGEFEEILGYHLEQAAGYLAELGPLDAHGQRLAERGATRLAAAGRRALGRGDMPASANLLRRAVQLLPRGDARRLGLLPELGEALLEIGEFASAEVFLDEASECAVANDDLLLQARAGLVRLLLRTHSSPPEHWSGQLEGDAEDIMRVLEEAQDNANLAAAARLLAVAHGNAGRHEDSADMAARAIEYATFAGDERQRSKAACHYAQVATYGPTPVADALRRCEELLEQTSGDRRTQGIVTGLLARLHAMQANFEYARALYTRGYVVLEDMGRSVAAASTSIDSCAVEMLAGDPAAAEAELRRDYAQLEQMGEKGLLSTIAGELARAVYARGAYDEAHRLTVTAQRLAADEDILTQALWRMVRAKVLAQRGTLAEAQRFARRAVELLRPTGDLISQAEALMDLAEVLEVAGEIEEAEAALADARSLFERKGDIVSGGRARKRLSALAAA
jgi:class 3 adenylate cyclase/tetratricopeptide (TPR) repeat protein